MMILSGSLVVYGPRCDGGGVVLAVDMVAYDDSESSETDEADEPRGFLRRGSSYVCHDEVVLSA